MPQIGTAGQWYGRVEWVPELLVGARLVAQWAEGCVADAVVIANLLAGRIVLAAHCCEAVQEAEHANNGRNHEHLCVEAEPTKVQRYFVPEIFADQAERLLLVELDGSRPLQVQQSPVQSGPARVRLVVAALVQRKAGQVGAVAEQSPDANLWGREDGCEGQS